MIQCQLHCYYFSLRYFHLQYQAIRLVLASKIFITPKSYPSQNSHSYFNNLPQNFTVKLTIPKPKIHMTTTFLQLTRTILKCALASPLKNTPTPHTPSLPVSRLSSSSTQANTRHRAPANLENAFRRPLSPGESRKSRSGGAETRAPSTRASEFGNKPRRPESRGDSGEAAPGGPPRACAHFAFRQRARHSSPRRRPGGPSPPPRGIVSNFPGSPKERPRGRPPEPRAREESLVFYRSGEKWGVKGGIFLGDE